MTGPELFLHGHPDVSRETLDRLERLADLVRKWSPRINLVAPGTLDDLWQRHILDSAQLAAHVPDGARHLADLGSGGGFPGLVLAILLAERPDPPRITLVDSDRRKATFLRTALRETGVAAQVAAARIDALDPLGADVVTARALAPLPRLFPLVFRHLAPGGVALLQKGATHAAELRESLAEWRIACEEVPSRTDPRAVVLKVSEMSRA